MRLRYYLQDQFKHSLGVTWMVELQVGPSVHELSKQQTCSIEDWKFINVIIAVITLTSPVI